MAAVFLWLALSRLSYIGLFTGMLLVMLASRFVSAAYQGLLALVGQERLMSGRLSALWQVVSTLPVLAGAFASGWMAEHLRPAQTFLLLAAALAAVLGLLGLWKPAGVFKGAYEAPQARGSDLVGDLKRLFRHRAIYPAVLLILLFQFAPGANTPLQYYLTNHLHASDEIYGDFQGIFAASFIPVFLLYGWLCKRVSLGKLLFWGVIISIPQMIPLAFIHSAAGALWWAKPIGAMGGIAAAGIFDLAMRSCPPGMQGSLMMMVEAGNLLSTRGGDLLGSWIYGSSPTHGFLYCVIAITVVYALMLPVLRLIPRELLVTTDGEPNPAVEAELLAEIAGDGLGESLREGPQVPERLRRAAPPNRCASSHGAATCPFVSSAWIRGRSAICLASRTRRSPFTACSVSPSTATRAFPTEWSFATWILAKLPCC